MSKIMKNDVVLDKDGLRGVSRYLSEDLELVELSLAPGAELFKHELPIPVVFYVLQGRGILTLDGEETEVEQGDILECPPASQRQWRNIGTCELSLLVMKKIA